MTPVAQNFLTCYEIQSLKTKTKGLACDGQLPECFITIFPTGRRDNSFPLMQGYLVNKTP